MADTYDLRKRAVLVKVTTKVLGVKKKDNDLTATLAREYQADADVVHGGVDIINTKNPLFKKIIKTKGLISNTNRDMTGPWQDDGFRIIGTKRYAQWRQIMDDMVSTFEADVDDFVKNYVDVLAEAKIKLGNAYDESRYPSPSEIRDAFVITLETEVLPDRTNTIIDLDKARHEKIVADAQALDGKRTQSLTEHTHKVVRETLGDMITALKEFGDDIPNSKRTRSFKDTLVENMATLADTLPGLNITGDTRLDKLTQRIADKLTTVDANELRGTVKVKGDTRTKEVREADALKARETTLSDAEDIFDDLEDVFGSAENA